jgi:HlyD family secretion protein
LAQVESQIEVQDVQKNVALADQKRYISLVDANAAPSKQLDDINNSLLVINAQIVSTRTQYQAINSDIKALQYQIVQIDDQLYKSVIRNPISGIVLEKYIENTEIAVPGKSIYKIADLSVLKLKVFVSGVQLPKIKIGQKVQVYIDESETKNKEMNGVISWISQQAEFTPKIIQTKDERVNLVYGVKIDVVNDGSLKIGMPGEIKF